MWRQVCALALGVAVATPAQAQWMAQKEENPFTNSTVHYAMTASDRNTALGFRCETGGEEPALVYITNESAEGMDQKAVQTFNMMGVKLLLIIDKEPRVDLEGRVEVVTIAGRKRIRIVVDGDEANEMVRKVASARGRVAAAIEVMGKVLSQSTFSTGGSKRVLTGVFDACGLKPPAG